MSAQDQIAERRGASKGLLASIIFCLLLAVWLLSQGDGQENSLLDYPWSEPKATLRTSPGSGDVAQAENRLPSQTLRVLDPGPQDQLQAPKASPDSVAHDPGSGALNQAPKARNSSSPLAALEDVSKMTLGNLTPDYPLARGPRHSTGLQDQGQSQLSASNLPGPGYPVYRPERVPSGQSGGPGHSAQGDESPTGSSEGSDDEVLEFIPAEAIYTPAIFPYEDSEQDMVTVEFTIFADSNFHVSLIEGTGNGKRDQEILEGLKFWEWEPASRNGEKFTSKERVRLKNVSVSLEDWKRMKAEQEYQIQLRAQKRKKGGGK